MPAPTHGLTAALTILVDVMTANDRHASHGRGARSLKELFAFATAEAVKPLAQ